MAVTIVTVKLTVNPATATCPDGKLECTVTTSYKSGAEDNMFQVTIWEVKEEWFVTNKILWTSGQRTVPANTNNGEHVEKVTATCVQPAQSCLIQFPAAGGLPAKTTEKNPTKIFAVSQPWEALGQRESERVTIQCTHEDSERR